MLERSQTTTLLQLFCELLLYSKVISKSMKVADDTFQRISGCEWVKFETKTFMEKNISLIVNIINATVTRYVFTNFRCFTLIYTFIQYIVTDIQLMHTLINIFLAIHFPVRMMKQR